MLNLNTLARKNRLNVVTRRRNLSEIISESYSTLYECTPDSKLYNLVESHIEDINRNPEKIRNLSKNLDILKGLSTLNRVRISESDIIDAESDDLEEDEEILIDNELDEEDEIELDEEELDEEDEIELDEEDEEYLDEEDEIELDEEDEIELDEEELDEEELDEDELDEDEEILIDNELDEEDEIELDEEDEEYLDEEDEIELDEEELDEEELDEDEEILIDNELDEEELDEEELDEEELDSEDLASLKQELAERRSRESKSWRSESKSMTSALKNFRESSKKKAFFKSFKQLKGLLESRKRLSLDESILLYKASNSAMTHLTVELEHNPNFIYTFRECSGLLARDNNKLLNCIRTKRSPGKSLLESYKNFSRILLESDGLDDEIIEEEEEVLSPSELDEDVLDLDEGEFDPSYGAIMVEFSKNCYEETGKYPFDMEPSELHATEAYKTMKSQLGK